MKQLFLKIFLGLISIFFSGGITLVWMNYMTEVFSSDVTKYIAVGVFHFLGMVIIYQYLKRMVFNAQQRTSKANK